MTKPTLDQEPFLRVFDILRMCLLNLGILKVPMYSIRFEKVTAEKDRDYGT